jgi:hypothetical protein
VILDELNADMRRLKGFLRSHAFPPNLISAIETRALRSGRRQTGVFQSNRTPRWRLIHAVNRPGFTGDSVS